MPDISTLGTIAKLGTQAEQTFQQRILSLIQGDRARKMRKELGSRPDYETPESAEEALGLSRSLASESELPGAGRIRNRLSGSTATGARSLIDSSSSPGAVAANIATLYAGEKDALVNLELAGINRQDQNRGRFLEQLGVMAGFEDKKFMLNELQPWLELRAAAKEMENASIQNFFGAGQSSGTVASSAIDKFALTDKQQPINFLSGVKSSTPAETIS